MPEPFRLYLVDLYDCDALPLLALHPENLRPSRMGIGIDFAINYDKPKKHALLPPLPRLETLIALSLECFRAAPTYIMPSPNGWSLQGIDQHACADALD